VGNEAVSVPLLASVETLRALSALVSLQEVRGHVIVQRMRGGEPATAPVTGEWVTVLLLQMSDL